MVTQKRYVSIEGSSRITNKGLALLRIQVKLMQKPVYVPLGALVVSEDWVKTQLVKTYEHYAKHATGTFRVGKDERLYTVYSSVIEFEGCLYTWVRKSSDSRLLYMYKLVPFEEQYREFTHSRWFNEVEYMVEPSSNVYVLQLDIVQHKRQNTSVKRLAVYTQLKLI